MLPTCSTSIVISTSTVILKRKHGGWLYKDKFYPDYLTVGGASHAIFREAQEFCRGRGIDVGAGLWALPGATPVDVWRGPGYGKTIWDFEMAHLTMSSVLIVWNTSKTGERPLANGSRS